MATRRGAFDPQTFVTTVGQGRKVVSVGKGQTIYGSVQESEQVID